MAKKETKKKTCAITRHQFRNGEKPKGTEVLAKIAENVPVTAKEFSTGSLGWNGTGKIPLMIDGELVKCQVTLNVTVVNSKEAEEGGPSETEAPAEQDAA